MENTLIHAIEGDITQIPTDAIVTAINSGGLWFVELMEQFKE